MEKWFMLTVVGKDRSGIVSHITAALYEGGCHLGEASMLRLGGNFTIMLMVKHEGTVKSLTALVDGVTESMGLTLHVDKIDAHLHQHIEPDVRITVSGADRAGIVSQVTTALAEAGLNILNLASDVAGNEDKPIYVMYIEGKAEEGIGSLNAAMEVINEQGIDANLDEIETLIG